MAVGGIAARAAGTAVDSAAEVGVVDGSERDALGAAAASAAGAGSEDVYSLPIGRTEESE